MHNSILLPPMAMLFGSRLWLSVFPEYKILEDGPIKYKVEDLARQISFPVETIYMSEPNLEEPEEMRNDVPYVRLRSDWTKCGLIGRRR